MHRISQIVTPVIAFVAATVVFISMVAGPVDAAERSKKLVKFETSMGDIVIEVFPKEAPITAENFLQYAREGFYDGTIFHRIIKGFVIQGGGFDESFKEKTTREPIKNEADNGLKNQQYTLSMARTPDPDSASSQFFINLADNKFLDFKSKSPQGWGYAVFGRVVEGMDVVDKAALVKTGRRGPHEDVPEENVVILKATVTE